MDIYFLTLDEVLDLHRDQIDRYGGDPALRDLGLLQSAVGMPSAAFGGVWLHDFPHGMAAAYLFHLAQNHPFVDGNKRTGLAAALTFLKLNGFEMHADPHEVEELVIRVASGQIDKASVIAFFQKHVST
jgi:death-on-curing protein